MKPKDNDKNIIFRSLKTNIEEIMRKDGTTIIPMFRTFHTFNYH